MSRRPDRKTVNEGTRAKQERDAEGSNGNGDFGEYISTFNIPKDDFFKFAPDEEQNIDIIPFEVTTKNHPDFNALTAYDDGNGGKYREDYAMDYFVHRKLGPGGRADVLCLEKNFGKDCPACEERKRLLDEKAFEWGDAELAPFKWKKRSILNVKDLNDGGKMKPFDYPEAHFKRNLLKKSKRVRGAESQICLSDISEDGYSITFFAEASDMKDDKTGKPITFKDGSAVPSEIKDIEFTKRTKGYDDSIIDEALKLDTLMNIFSYEDIKKIMDGTYKSEGDDSVEETPKENAPVKEENEIPEEKPEMTERERRLAQRAEKKASTEKGDEVPTCPNGMTFCTDNLSDDCCNEESCTLYQACTDAYEKENG